VMRMTVFAIVLAACGAGQAVAQNCSDASTAGMTPGEIDTLVANKYACVGSSPNAQWNELHAGSQSGSVLDYKLGPADPNDPSDTLAHPTGAFRITAPGGAQSPGVITYSYGTNSYGYNVVNNLGPPRYSYCGFTGGAPQLAVTISPSHC
jgi:hypothetical protein